MRVVDSDFLPQIFPRFFILVRLSPLPHKSILVHSAQKNSHNFIVFAEMMQMEQKIVDFFSIKVYLRIKIWIQNQISKIINQKRKSKTFSDPFKYREDHGGLVSGIGRSAGVGNNDCEI